MTGTHVNPTEDFYRSLTTVYDHFNQSLFNNALAPCFFTLQRRGRITYSSPERWAHAEGEIHHQIALNPAYLAERTLSEVLQDIAREQCTVWQYQYGKPGRPHYQNQQWAEKMIAIGLMPTDSGEIGGKITGQDVSHYVIAGGQFEKASLDLVRGGFRFMWLDRNFAVSEFPPANLDALDDEVEPEVLLANKVRASFPKLTHWLIGRPKSRNKIQYVCPHCFINVWGRPELSVNCGRCNIKLEVLAEPDTQNDEDEEMLASL